MAGCEPHVSTDQPTRTFFLTAEEGRVENRSENRGGTWMLLVENFGIYTRVVKD